MKTSNFQDCCGAYIIHGFGNTRIQLCPGYAPSKEELEVAISGSIRHGSFTFATLNHEQKPIVGPILKRHGFRCVESAYHPAHNSTIYGYLRNNQKANKSKRK